MALSILVCLSTEHLVWGKRIAVMLWAGSGGKKKNAISGKTECLWKLMSLKYCKFQAGGVGTHTPLKTVRITEQ